MAQDDYDPHPRPVPGPTLLRAMEELRAMYPPAPREDARDDSATTRESEPDAVRDPAKFDHAAALREYLLLLDDGIKFSLGDHYERLPALALAPRLIKSSLDVALWLKQMSGAMDERGGERRFTQRIIVEHIGARPALGPGLGPAPRKF